MNQMNLVFNLPSKQEHLQTISSAELVSGNVPAITRSFFSDSSSTIFRNQIFRQNYGQIASNIGIDTVLSLFEETKNQNTNTRNNTFHNRPVFVTSFIFHPPEDILNTELPKCLELIHEVQNLFLNFDINSKEQTLKLVDFIENHICTGLRELSINIFLRPQKVKDYVHLYTLLSKNVKIIACQYLVCTPIFSHYLIQEKICSEFEAKQFLITNNGFCNYLLQISNLVDRYNSMNYEKNKIEIIEAFIDDNLDKFIEITSKTNLSESKELPFLTELSALYGAVNCFKYLLVHEPNLSDICNFAIIGGNKEIIRLLIQKEFNFRESSVAALYFRRDDLFDWIQSETKAEDTQENRNHIEYAITDTLSIQAIYSLTKKNRLIYTNDWLSVFSLDDLIEPVKELSKSCMFLGSLFFKVTNNEIINNFLDNAQTSYIIKLLRYAIKNGYSLHIRAIVSHPKFVRIYQTNPKIFDEIKKENPEIFDEIQNQLQNDDDLDRNYHNFINGIIINYSIVFDLMKYSMKMNDLQTFIELFKKFKHIDLHIEQLIELLQLSSLTWPVASKKIVEKEPDGTVCIPLTRYFSISEYNGVIPAQVADIILKDQDLQSQLTAYDCINLLSMIQPKYTDISPLISLLRKFGFITDSQHKGKLETLNEIQEIVYNSPKIDELAKEDINAFLNIIPPHLDFINKIIGMEVTKEFYDKILQLYIIMFKPINRERLRKNSNSKLNEFPEEMIKLHSDFLDFLTDPVNKKHIDIKELSKIKFNLDFIRHLEFSSEEIQFLMKSSINISDLIFNPVNTRFFSIEKIIKYGNMDTIIYAILNNPLSQEDIRFIESYITQNDIDRDKTIVRKFFRRDEICNNFDTRALYDVFIKDKSYDEISFKILDTLLSRDLEISYKILIFLKIPTSKEVYDFIISRREKINNSCLIIYSTRTSTQIVEKGTPIEDIYFEKIFLSSAKINYELLFDYKVSKHAIALGLLNSIKSKNINGMNFLISKGAPINVIIDSITPLQMAISSCFLKGVQILISLGASLGFNGLQTALNACTGCSNSEIVTLIKSKADNDYESRYKNYSPPTFSSSSNEDLIRRINSKYRNPLPSNINLDMLSDMMNNSYDYDIALNILLSIANIDHSPIDILTPEQAEFRDKLPIHIRNELWNFVKNNINNSYPAFRTAYCAITGAKLDNPYSRHSHLLFIATRLGNFNAVKNLIEYGASIEEVEGFSCFFSPSLEAISKDRSDILSLFIKAGLRFDHIYSIDNFTLINACIEFNSMKCFDLLFEKSSLRHVVVETPMMAALQTFERTGNDYFINKLIDKIDIEYEYIVDPSFAEYLLFKEGKIPKFHYTSYQRPKLTRKTNNINILVDKLNQSGIAQPILAYKVLEVNFHANINEVNRLRIPVILH